jgi:hypothetical protein
MYTPMYHGRKINERLEEFRSRAGPDSVPALKTADDAYYYASLDHDAPLAFIPKLPGLPQPDEDWITCMTDTWARNFMKNKGYPPKYWLIHRKSSISAFPSFRLSVGLLIISDPFVSFQPSTFVVNHTRAASKT